MSLDVRMLTEGPATGLTWRDLEGELKAKPAGLVEDLHLAFEMVIDDHGRWTDMYLCTHAVTRFDSAGTST